MSERIYTWLLHLYPSHFRKVYGDEALQLFRDRARDERGLLSGIRLWLDLLGDLAISVPREYRHNHRVVVSSPAPHCLDGTPSFHILEHKALSFGSLLYGGVVSLVVYGSVLFVMGHGRSHFTFADSNFQPHPRYAATTAKATPTLVFSYLPTNPTTGSTVSFTATVTGVGNRPTPTGNVRFLYGYTFLNAGRLNNGVVTVKVKGPNPKTHPFRALYIGDLNYNSALQIEQK
jgi:Bacterial Ig-like domain (group 3)